MGCIYTTLIQQQGDQKIRLNQLFGLINMDKTSGLWSEFLLFAPAIFVVHEYKVRYSFRFTGSQGKIKFLAGTTNGKSSLVIITLLYSRILAASDKRRV